jgi:hypothetical protein
MSLWNFLAADPLLVKIAVPFPYGLLKILSIKNFYLLIKSIASSNVLAVKTQIDGPKISSLYAVISVRKLVIIVGPMKFPFSYPGTLGFLPSRSNFPPSFSTVSKIL